MRCLDEGVDVPPARIGIIVANSGNPREYIQRRGRLLRKYPGKENAVIHDIIVEPPLFSDSPLKVENIEKNIFLKELIRYREFASSAINADECLRSLNDSVKTYGLS